MSKLPKEQRAVQLIWKNKKYSKKLSIYLFKHRKRSEDTPTWRYRFQIHGRYKTKPLWTSPYYTTPEEALVVGLYAAKEIQDKELFTNLLVEASNSELLARVKNRLYGNRSDDSQDL